MACWIWFGFDKGYSDSYEGSVSEGNSVSELILNMNNVCWYQWSKSEVSKYIISYIYLYMLRSAWLR